MARIIRSDPNLIRHGPVIAVTIEPVIAVQEILRLGGESVPSVTVSALVDTGASGSAVKASVLDRFNIEAAGEYFAHTPSTTGFVPVPKYRLRLVLAAAIAFEINVAAVPMGGQNVQCLIGRDILQYGVLTYNGPRNSFTLNIRAPQDDE